MINLAVIDLLIQNKDYLTLEPLYTNIEVIRVHVDTDNNLKILETNNFMSGYFECIRKSFDTHDITKLFGLITNIEGANVFICKLFFTINNERDSKFDYITIDCMLFVHMLKFVNESQTFSNLYKTLGNTLFDRGHNGEQICAEREDFCNNVIKVFLDNNKFDELREFVGRNLDYLIGEYIFGTTILNKKLIKTIVVTYPYVFEFDMFNVEFESKKVKSYVMDSLKSESNFQLCDI